MSGGRGRVAHRPGQVWRQEGGDGVRWQGGLQRGRCPERQRRGRRAGGGGGERFRGTGGGGGARE
eukprot:6865039-Lingulodinium_polyedra.AAC.1